MLNLCVQTWGFGGAIICLNLDAQLSWCICEFWGAARSIAFTEFSKGSKIEELLWWKQQPRTSPPQPLSSIADFRGLGRSQSVFQLGVGRWVHSQIGPGMLWCVTVTVDKVRAKPTPADSACFWKLSWRDHADRGSTNFLSTGRTWPGV